MVLKHGIKVGDKPTAETTMDEVVGLMVGARGDSLEEARAVAAVG
jgi:ABC-type sugar transport system ATPase subunit